MAALKGVQVIQCDAPNCLEKAVVSRGDVYPGYSGTCVDGSCGISVTWHACKMNHIESALRHLVYEEAKK